VIGVVDYLDPVAYAKVRGDRGRVADFASAAGSLPERDSPTGAGAVAIHDHVAAMTRAGRWRGSAELIDHAGDDAVAWAQWNFRGPHGDFPGWSLRRANGLVIDLFDTVTAWQLSQDDQETAT
jgi:hypothetical protein